jgi:hypothetical protein
MKVEVEIFDCFKNNIQHRIYKKNDNADITIVIKADSGLKGRRGLQKAKSFLKAITEKSYFLGRYGTDAIFSNIRIAQEDIVESTLVEFNANLETRWITFDPLSIANDAFILGLNDRSLIT